jgi:hypothetical protein
MWNFGFETEDLLIHMDLGFWVYLLRVCGSVSAFNSILVRCNLLSLLSNDKCYFYLFII